MFEYLSDDHIENAKSIVLSDLGDVGSTGMNDAKRKVSAKDHTVVVYEWRDIVPVPGSVFSRINPENSCFITFVCNFDHAYIWNGTFYFFGDYAILD